MPIMGAGTKRIATAFDNAATPVEAKLLRFPEPEAKEKGTLQRRQFLIQSAMLREAQQKAGFVAEPVNYTKQHQKTDFSQTRAQQAAKQPGIEGIFSSAYTRFVFV